MLQEISCLTTPTGIIGFNRKKTSPAEDNIYYTLKDYLGSIMVVTSETGTKLEEYSYDAWGRRRNVSNWTYSSVSAPTYITRGYTGHEHIEEVGLINMNGRVYDPLVGLFLSPDPIVQAPGNALNYNRYSYAFNNPLKYTDPSGYYLESAYRDAARRMANKGYDETGRGGGSRVFGAWYMSGPYSGSSADWANNYYDSYSYNWTTGSYENSSGEIVSRNTVHTNYLLPSALVTKNGVEAQNLVQMFQEANFNVSFETAGNTVGFVAYEGVLPSGVIDAWTISGRGAEPRAQSGGGKEFPGLPENLAAAMGTLAGMIEAGKVSSDMWYSPKTGKWHSMSTANGATGPRNPVLKSAKNWNNVAKGAFYAGAIISTGDMIYYYATGGTGWEKAAWTGVDITVGAIAMWGGPVGMAVGVVYMIATSPGPNIAPSPYISNPMSPWNTMPRIDNTGINNGGGF